MTWSAATAAIQQAGVRASACFLLLGGGLHSLMAIL